MSIATDIITDRISKAKIESIIKPMAILAEIGGRSEVRGDDRMETLPKDQLTGQIASYVFCKYWFGDVRYWLIDRFYRNQNPKSGDSGFDIAGMTMDIKGSRLLEGRELTRYRLPVRPKERHAEWIYALVIVDYDDLKSTEAVVSICGWARDSELVVIAQEPDRLAGAYIVTFDKLHPFPNYQWRWVNGNGGNHGNHGNQPPGYP